MALTLGLPASLILQKGLSSGLIRQKFSGYGNTVMVNGGFLLLFDVIMYSVHHHYGKELNGLINTFQVAGTGTGVSVSDHF